MRATTTTRGQSRNNQSQINVCASPDQHCNYSNVRLLASSNNCGLNNNTGETHDKIGSLAVFYLLFRKFSKTVWKLVKIEQLRYLRNLESFSRLFSVIQISFGANFLQNQRSLHFSIAVLGKISQAEEPFAFRSLVNEHEHTTDGLPVPCMCVCLCAVCIVKICLKCFRLAI